MKLTKKQRFIGFILLFILGLSIFLKTPACYYPKEEIEVREAEEEDIQTTQNILEEEGVVFKYMVGLSMYPTLRPGMVCSCVKKEYKEGDIISFFSHDYDSLNFISHRIVESLPNGQYITKGDNNWKIDPYVVEEEQIFCAIEEISFFEYYMRMAMQ